MEIETVIQKVETPQQWSQLQIAMDAARVVGLDIETTPVRWYEDGFRILTVAFSTEEDHAFVVPVQHPETEPGVAAQLIRLKNEIEGFKGNFIMQGGDFDHMALRKFGIDLLSWDDTMVMEYLIDVDARKRLQDLAKRYLDIDKWKDINYKKPEEEDLDTLMRLNGRDADVTRRLDAILQSKVEESGKEILYDGLMMPVIEVLCDMEWAGIPVDKDRLLNLIDETERQIERVLDSIREISGKGTGKGLFNPNSFKQLGKLLYGELGLPCVMWTDKGAPSTSAEALRKIKHKHRIVPMVMEYRKLRKLYTASLQPWFDKLDKDNRLHPRYKPAHVKTGRLASEMPNIQQVPRGAPREVFGGVVGYKMVEIDFSQMELRIVAWTAGEKTMLDAFARGDDLHQITADAFGVDRQTAKALNFGLLYGAGPRKLKWIAEEQYGVTLTELQATKLRLQWFKKYPGIQDYHESAVREAYATGGISTAFGRWRPLPDIKSQEWGRRGGAERQAINTPIQSVASDITLVKLIEVAKHPSVLAAGIRPLATVHDSILFLVPEPSLEVIPAIQRMMEDTSAFRGLFGVEIDVPIVTDVTIGDHWS